LKGSPEPSLSRIILPDGQVRHVENRTGCEFGQANDVIAIYGTMVDATEREVARATLTASEAHLRLLTDHARDLIIEYDVGRTILYASPSVGRYGYAPSGLVATDIEGLIHPDDLEAVRATIAQVMGGEPLDPTIDRSYRIRTAAGEAVWMEGSPFG